MNATKKALKHIERKTKELLLAHTRAEHGNKIVPNCDICADHCSILLQTEYLKRSA